MSNICLITGSSGLIGSESVMFFSDKFDKIIGIDNNMRAYFFGDNASTEWNTKKLSERIPNFKHYSADIRDEKALEKVFSEYGTDIKLIIHTAAQPSHDWAAREPITDFTVNANGTLNLLEMTRKHCPDATFIFTSTNKVYGDTPNFLPLIELENRWEIDESHPYYKEGIDEKMSIDQTKHSLFGASKVAADVLVQEYGRYFGMKSGIFRGGCLTGPNHSGTQLHGFLAYLMKCAITGEQYTIFGYKGKQVRDQIHSEDVVRAFEVFIKNPKPGAVYNLGGGRGNSASILECIDLIKEYSGHQVKFTYNDTNRIGDHICYMSDLSRFMNDYPDWKLTYSLEKILKEIIEAQEKLARVSQCD